MLDQLTQEYAALEARVAALESQPSDPFNGGDPSFPGTIFVRDLQVRY